MSIQLARPSARYEQQVMRYRQAMLENGDSFDGCAGLEDTDRFSDWICFAQRLKAKYGAGYVPSEVFLAIRREDDTVVGIIDYRHPLSPFLLQYGGNIGYSVHPSERGKGYASQMLKRMLPICRAYGETRVLLTCDPQNTASQKTILRCGGNLENEVEDSAGLGASGVIVRYWIPLEDWEQQDIAMLTSKDTDSACAFAGKIIDESKESGMWYGCFDAFAALLDHSNSFVRNRAIRILEALAPWDAEDRFEAILPHFLSRITDEKPITARQCVQSLAQVGQAKPRLIGAIVSALRGADVSHYRDSMRPLVEKDIAQTLKRLAETDEDRRIVKADGSFGKP